MSLKLQKKFGPNNMFVLTARPADSANSIYEFLKLDQKKSIKCFYKTFIYIILSSYISPNFSVFTGIVNLLLRISTLEPKV